MGVVDLAAPTLVPPSILDRTDTNPDPKEAFVLVLALSTLEAKSRRQERFDIAINNDTMK